MNLTSTVSVVELMWTILAGLGFMVHMALVIDAIKDKAALKGLPPEGPRNLVANINLWDDASRAVLQVAFLIIGLYAMFTPPNAAANSSASALPGIIILLMEVMLIVVSVSDLRAKVALLGMVTRYTLVVSDEALKPSSSVLEPTSPPIGSVAVSRQDSVTTVQVRDKETSYDNTQP